MAENRGGMRPTAPQNNPANISATGGAGQSGTQAARYIPGLPYGQGQTTMSQQMAAPMAGPNPSAPASPFGEMMPSVTPLTAPTERPNEPITSGMDFGAGPGSEVLNLPRERSLSQTLESMIEFDTTGEVQTLYDFVVSRGL
jgi:hypothetical protein